MLGGYVPHPIIQGIQEWIESGTERDISTFLREAAREKLRRDGIKFDESWSGNEAA